MRVVPRGDSFVVTGSIENVDGTVPDFTGVTASAHLRLKNAVKGLLYEVDELFIDPVNGVWAFEVPGADTELWPVLNVPAGQGNGTTDVRFTFPNGRRGFRISCDSTEFLVVA